MEIAKRLTAEEWLRRCEEHQGQVENLLGEWLAFKRRGEKHPVIDFLFEYYSFPYKKLYSWTPGFGVELAGDILPKLGENKFEKVADYHRVKKNLISGNRVAALQWIARLLQRSMENVANFNCYGMHEWAMVYKAEEVRHSYRKLRFSQTEISAIVEERDLVCTHYDAFRFFMPAALPKNRYKLSREEQENFEQSACLHVNMDLYKWAFKLYPLIDSALLLNCFKLALACREVDMRASPYDLRELGYEPICVENTAGREEYVREQRRLKKMAEPLRVELQQVYLQLIAALS